MKATVALPYMATLQPNPRVGLARLTRYALPKLGVRREVESISATSCVMVFWVTGEASTMGKPQWCRSCEATPEVIISSRPSIVSQQSMLASLELGMMREFAKCLGGPSSPTEGHDK